MDNLPLVSDEELSIWEQSTGEYLNRYAAKRLMFTVRDLRARITTLSKERDVYAEIVRNVAVDGLGLTDPWDVSSPTKAPDWTGLLSQRVADLRANLAEAEDTISKLSQRVVAAHRLQQLTQDNEVRWMDKHTAAEEELRQLREALGRIFPYRRHLAKCEIDPTDFCTCGMKKASDAVRTVLKGKDMIPTICTRKPNHEGPCNGYPHTTCGRN